MCVLDNPVPYAVQNIRFFQAPPVANRLASMLLMHAELHTVRLIVPSIKSLNVMWSIYSRERCERLERRTLHYSLSLIHEVIN